LGPRVVRLLRREIYFKITAEYGAGNEGEKGEEGETKWGHKVKIFR
jgi:hypothetical protein